MTALFHCSYKTKSSKKIFTKVQTKESTSLEEIKVSQARRVQRLNECFSAVTKTIKQLL